MPFSVDSESHDFRFRGPSLHVRCGQQMCHFDDSLQVDRVDLPVRCVRCIPVPQGAKTGGPKPRTCPSQGWRAAVTCRSDSEDVTAVCGLAVARTAIAREFVADRRRCCDKLCVFRTYQTMDRGT